MGPLVFPATPPPPPHVTPAFATVLNVLLDQRHEHGERDNSLVGRRVLALCISDPSLYPFNPRSTSQERKKKCLQTLSGVP